MRQTDWVLPIVIFSDLWLLRVAPNFLQEEVFHAGRGTISRWWSLPAELSIDNTRPYFSLATSRKLIEDETRRPPTGQYVYAHIYLPHGYYVLDSNCNYSPETSDYSTQSACAERLMSEYLTELRRLNRYDASTIIIQSDHGVYQLPDWEREKRTPEPEALRNNFMRIPPGKMAAMSAALLLIKPSNRKGISLEISEQPAQLVDIPATLYDLLHLVPNPPPALGISLFSNDIPHDRELHFFSGFRQRKEDGTEILLGRDFQKGEMNHFAFRISRGWVRYPNVHAEW